MKNEAVVIGLLAPNRDPNRIKALRDRPITSFALELLPRISRAQSMDALSSQATVAGYKAVLLAANLSQRFFPMLTTAAGTIRPTSVLIIGAGVAGLQAIATARRLGAMVSAYDIRAAAREQVESLGAKMIQINVSAESAGGYARQLTAEEQDIQKQALATAVSKSEVVICTAMIPGKPAPKILSKDMVEQMAPGAVIIDIAAGSGGNCELTVADQTINHQEVLISGPTNLASLMARDASVMYAKNLYNFVELMIKDGKLQIDWEDQVLKESALTHAGAIQHVPTRELVEGSKT
jgi:H+-translocating NAD(P) transhydrogenase subunit alpha